MGSDHLHQPMVGQNLLTKSIYNKVLNISCNLLNCILNMNMKMVLWVWNGCKHMGFHPRDLVTDWELSLPPLSSITRELHTAYQLPGKDQNSKYEACLLLYVYHFQTIVKLKNCKLNHLSQRPSIMSTFIKPSQKSSKLFSYKHWTNWHCFKQRA